MMVEEDFFIAKVHSCGGQYQGDDTGKKKFVATEVFIHPESVLAGLPVGSLKLSISGLKRIDQRGCLYYCISHTKYFY